MQLVCVLKEVIKAIRRGYFGDMNALSQKLLREDNLAT